MTALSDHPYAQALAWALLHFLWQGALLGLVAFVLFHVFSSPAARYRVGIAMLAAMLMTLAATTAWIARRAEPAAPAVVGATVVPDQLPSATEAPLGAAVDIATGARTGSTLPATVLLVWLTGVIALSARLLGGWLRARRVAHHDLRPAAPEIVAMTQRLAARLTLSRLVDVAESASVAVPIMIGWLKPIVILPTAVVSGFTPEQVEALVAHELAHVRRSDYLVNLLQAVVETVLFYHPAVWWVSRRVRTAREHCCDDLTVTICDRLVYARALSHLAEMATPQLAMAATGGPLVERVRRILGRPSQPAESGAGWLPVFLIMVLAAPALSTPFASSNQTTPTQAVTPQTAAAPAAAPAVEQEPAKPVGETSVKPTKAPAKQTAEAVVNAENRPQQVAALEAKIKQLLEAQRALDARRTDLEIAQHASETNSKLEALKVSMQALQAQAQRLSKQVDAGLVSPSELTDAQMQIRAMELEIAKVQKDREYFEMSARLNQAAADQQREYEQVIREYEAAYGKTFTSERQPIIDVETGVELGAGEPIRAGDILTISIPGEPDLPPTYRVTADGTIKLPLMPTLRVSGLTAAQAGEAINNQLKDRKVSTDPRVAITVRRPK